MLSLDFRALRSMRWHQYALRFLLGGLVTAAAGLVAQRWGPVPGGLFLAFPAIFPASATLIASREQQKKGAAGLDGRTRGRRAVTLDAAGTTLRACALGAFAVCLWKLLPHQNVAAVLSGAGILWLSLSVSLWWLRRKL
jgi:hypothetical protein